MEPIQNRVEFFNRADTEPSDVAILACYPITLDELGRGLNQPLHLMKPSGYGIDPHNRLQWLAEPALIENRSVAKDVVALLETLHMLGNAWRRQPYRPGQLLQGDGRTLGQDLDDLPVDAIQA